MAESDLEALAAEYARNQGAVTTVLDHIQDTDAHGGNGAHSHDDLASRHATVNVVPASAYTITAADAREVVELISPTPVTVTVPADATEAIDAGFQRELHQYGSGQVTVAAASGVTINSLNGSRKIAGRFGSVVLRKRGADEWELVGALEQTSGGVGAGLVGLDQDNLGLTLVETSTGVWSGDAPSRTVGVNPIIFKGASDPADPTDGIDTPANINDYDDWVVTELPS